MKDTGRQGRFGPGFRKYLEKMLSTSGAAGSDDRNGHSSFYGIDQLQVKAGIGAVPVDAVKQNFAGPQFFAGLGQGHGIHGSAFPPPFDGALVPAVPFAIGTGEMFQSRGDVPPRGFHIHPSRIDGNHHGLAAVDAGDLFNGAFPGFLPVFKYSSTIITASLPMEILSAPDRKYSAATSREV